jgi:LacI family transcriptional regulator
MSGSHMKNMTIKKLAKMINVSPTTVSNVLHGRENKMRPEVLKKVKNALEETKYVPNMAGRLLANRGSRLIGVIINYTERNESNVVLLPFYGEMIGALESEIRKNGYFMMFYSSANAEESLRIAAGWNIEGLVIMGGDADESERIVRGTDIPVVFIDQYFHPSCRDPINIGINDRYGGYLMTRYLIEQGHRRIAFMCETNIDFGVYYERYLGYRDALEEKSLPCLKEDYVKGNKQALHQRMIMHDFVRCGRIRDYTALFFGSDSYAVFAMNIFQDMGIKIPEDISIAGFDGSIFATHCRPLLTTVQQNNPQKAYYAIKMLLQCIKKEKIHERDIRLNVSLTIGNSIRTISR